MGWGSPFKKSRRQVNRENQERGRRGEKRIREKHEFYGKKVERTGRGHDFKVTSKDWLTGKKKIEYVEVKTGNSKLSPLQKKKRRQFGDRYVVERVNSGQFGIGSSTTHGVPKKKTSTKSSSSMWDSGRGTKRKKSTASSGGLWGSSSMWDSGRGTKRKKSTASSGGLWGSSSMWDSGRGTKRKKKSMW